jgi:cell division transport system permease protein
LNVDAVLKRWSKNFGLVVYLEEKVTKETENSLHNFFQKDPDIIEVKYISKEEAFNKLQHILGTNASILDDFQENPLPSSFELTLKRELLEPDIVKRKAEQITQMTGVEEVQYGEKWLSSLNTLSKTLKIGAIFLGCGIFIAITFITYGTIKIFFYRRKDEIETLKLLGATRAFIRLPFLWEGLFIGIISGIISTAALFSINMFMVHQVPDLLPSLKAVTIILPLKIYLIIPVAGAVMSFFGSFIAVGKIRY